MQPMAIDSSRRTLLKGLAISISAPAFVGGCATLGGDSRPTFAGCATRNKNQYLAVIANQYGQPIHQIPLADRGHGVAVNSALEHLVVFSRRPGHFFQVCDYQSGEIVQVKLASSQRYFYGHGCYSLDHRWLYVSECEQGSSQGIIGVYDSAYQYQKVAELRNFGIGPHEITALDNGGLAVAVGGIHTDGRSQLNLHTMQPSLSYLNEQGRLIEQVFLADHQLSIRHISAGTGSETDQVFCGLQNKGDKDEFPPLVFKHTQGDKKMQPLGAKPEQWARFDNYIGSIAATDKWVIATSPRGNCYGIWAQNSGELLEISSLADACGVTSFDDGFAMSSGSGAVLVSDANHSDKSELNHFITPIIWDNHWSVI
ncbi:hypothetical protein A9264_13515 [Vibrio sp. UCD-FRSSP16_10]|uniref:DUF1513 domain-containing protein n=1 Tax=unclassified Vibrio TaxID=2614977 RepID=UPI0007FBD147|nr:MULTISPECIES: DUF1513 domain-containing protein [unclassified Vibrio]OBT14789.1 hypothetical protein A9260_13730 [Vibrio sp. UCD-FRSSP16_30]OBT20078.1 hypothetical protein A9264_13515 [Vibrio sp. UCD-FRSSP16_10]